MKKIKVLRKNGSVCDFDNSKIAKALKLSASTIQKEISEDLINTVVLKTKEKILTKHNDSEEITISVGEIHDIVIYLLESLDYDIYKQYRDYRNYKIRYLKSFESIKGDTLRVVNYEDKENANKDTTIISTKKELTAGVTSQELVLEFEIPKKSALAHKQGMIYIHDLRDLIFGSFNCSLFDMGNVIKNGFNLNGIKIEEPESFETFMDLVVDIMLVASSQQFGGFSIPELDSIGSKYLEKTYNRIFNELLYYGIDLEDAKAKAYEKTWNIALKKIRMFEYKVNCVTNSTGQTPFLTVSYGLATDEFGRMISKAMLSVRMEGMGEKKVTAIFPKLIFLHRKDINGDTDSINYDIKKMSIMCSSKRQYPDWLSLDGKFKGSPGEVYDRCEKAITPMGCRSFLSYWENSKGEEQYLGRFNIGVVTLLLARIALESNKDENKFFEMLEDNFYRALDVLIYRYDKLSKQKASSNPLFFVEGGCAVRLNPEDTIEKALECATASIGYIALDEASYYMTGKSIAQDITFANKVMKRLYDLVEKAKVDTNRLIAFYASPSEGLCHKALERDLKDYGVIDGVTDKEWYTNSFHINVSDKVSAIDKTNIEYELYKYSGGGRIMYTEWPHMDNIEALEQYLNYCMELGIYTGVNFDNGVCHDCGAKGGFIDGYCTVCGSTNVLVINRCCGYLGVSSSNGKTRYNKGKEAEVKNRVKHYNYIQENCIETI